MAYSNNRICPACGAVNRVPARHLADGGKCGSCRGPLAPESAPLEVDASAFEDIVGNARVPVFVDFWASWCGPCRTAAPEVAGLASDMSGKALVLKVDTERNQDLAARLGIRSIPNFVIFDKGRPVFQRAGLASRAEMRRWVEESVPDASPSLRQF